MLATWKEEEECSVASSFELSGNYTSEINFGFPYLYTLTYAETYKT